jgi:8-hydroxy-5-deazaflavin:NADPH oxidoreductase
MSYPSPVTIGILGSGNMGRALGLRYFQAGHQVFFGGRQPTEAPLRAAQLANTLRNSALLAKYGSLDEAAQFADVLIWTMRERDQSAVLSDVGVKSLDGKLILDLNNRDFSDEVMGGPEKLGSKYFERSLGEQLQANLPFAHVVKAFNTVAMEALDTSPEKLRAANAQVFVAGCRASEKRGLANDLVEELGFEAIDLGDGPTAVRIAEAMGDAVRYIMIENKKGGTANIGLRFLPKPNLGIVGAREQSSYH